MKNRVTPQEEKYGQRQQNGDSSADVDAKSEGPTDDSTLNVSSDVYDILDLVELDDGSVVKASALDSAGQRKRRNMYGCGSIPVLSNMLHRIYSIRVILPTSVMLLILITAITIWAVNYTNGNSAATDLSKMLQEEIASRMKLASTNFLKQVENLNKVMQRDYQLGFVDINDKESIRKILWGRVIDSPNVNCVYFSNENDWVLIYERLIGKTNEFVFWDRTGSDPNAYIYAVDNTTGLPQYSNLVYTRENYTARDQSWYQFAFEMGTPAWTASYAYDGPSDAATACVTFESPLYNGTSRVGVASIDVTLIDLNNFLKSTKIATNGRAFILQTDGLVVASSDGVISDPSNTDPDTAGRLYGKKSSDPAIASVSSFVLDKYTQLGDKAFHSSTDDALFVTMPLNGQNYFVLAVHFQYSENVDWLVCILIPETDILGKIITANWVTLGVSAAIVVGSLLYGIVSVVILIILPLNRLSKALVRVSKMDLGSQSKKKVMLYEMALIERSFFKMVVALQSLAKFVPSAVIAQVMSDAMVSDLRLNKKYVSVFFSDVENFTAHSEKLSPKDLLLLMGDLMEEMSSIIAQERGTIDKFIGDAIMAIYNAPIDVPGHEYHAVMSAIRIQRRLVLLRQRWERRNLPPLRVRIGIHSGDVLIGNFGSSNRLNFTCIGDTVNLAARCEPLCKYYGVYTLITDELYGKVKDKIVARAVDFCTVKGKTIPITLYEPISERSVASKDELKLEELSEQAIDHLKPENARNILDVDQSNASRAVMNSMEEGICAVDEALQLAGRSEDMALRNLRSRLQHYWTNPHEYTHNNSFVFHSKE